MDGKHTSHTDGKLLTSIDDDSLADWLECYGHLLKPHNVRLWLAGCTDEEIRQAVGEVKRRRNGITEECRIDGEETVVL